MRFPKRSAMHTFPQKAWVAFGFIFVGIGAIGLILPLMPGLVFFILAAFCFARGSRRFLRALLSNRHVGPQIMDWKRGKGMYVKTKVMAVSAIVPSMGLSAVYLVKQDWVKGCIVACSLLAVAVILSVKTKK